MIASLVRVNAFVQLLQYYTIFAAGLSRGADKKFFLCYTVENKAEERMDMLRRVTHVFLDVDNTLLDFEACAKSASVSALAAWGIDGRLYDHAVFTEVNNSLWSALERGEIDRGEIHRTRWGLVFDRLGIEADGEAFEYAFLAAIPQSVVPVEGAMEILAYLAGKYPLYAASNAPHEQQITRLSAAGMLEFFTDVFTSELLGAPKPAPAFFEGIFARLEGVDPAGCVLVGDSLTADVAGAARAGMQTVFFDFKQSGAVSPFSDETIRSLRELKLLL